jgi:hypothetical protein
MNDIVSIDLFLSNTEFPEAGDICERYELQIFGSVEKIMDAIRDKIVAGKPVIGVVINRKGATVEEFLGTDA